MLFAVHAAEAQTKPVRQAKPEAAAKQAAPVADTRPRLRRDDTPAPAVAAPAAQPVAKRTRSTRHKPAETPAAPAGTAPADAATAAPKGAKAAPKGAKVGPRDILACAQDRVADLAVAGCTRIIEDAKQKPKARGVAFYNRGNAYVLKGDPDKSKLTFGMSGTCRMGTLAAPINAKLRYNADTRQFYGQIVSELETIVAEYLNGPEATVADTLMATSRVYSLFQSIALEDSEQQVEVPDELDQEDASKLAEEMRTQREPDRQPQRRDARELFNAWNTDAEGEFDELEGSEAWSEGEVPEQDLEAGEVAFNYDEWDRELVDHRVAWCRVIEKRVKRGDRAFVDDTRDRHRGAISSIRHQFQLMKPENLTRILNELDGEDYDLNAVVDFFIDRRADGHQSERIYTRRLRRRRDVAVSFLLDQSSSTARTIGRHPLQPYTHPGRRIIEIEKEGLVLMSEALEAVGDIYSINGFTSEGRRNVKFYVLKDFNEQYSDEVMRRIGGITYKNNTRLGAAIRHASARLEKQEARTRLLIVLSDGRPYDHDYGDARYAREDTREALRQAKTAGITPFCITIDRESESELRDLYGEIGYTIIDDVMSLPERMPGIYRRLTT